MNREQRVAPNRLALGTKWHRRTWFAALLGTAMAGLARGADPVRGSKTSKQNVSPKSLASFRVRSVLELQGEVRLKNQNGALERKNGKQLVARTAPVTATSTLDYDEQYGTGDGSDRCVQYYHEANSEITIDSHVTKTVLRDNSREIVKFMAGAGMVTASPANPLFAAERDLVDGSLTSMFLDQILTQTDVAIGDKWNVDATAAARLLNLDAIHDGKLTVCLVDIDDKQAQLALEGTLSGSVRSVATEMVVEGKGVLDRKGGYVSWLALKIDETREIGEAEPGFHVVANLRVLRAPVENLTNGATLADAFDRLGDTDAASLLQFQSDKGFYRFLADRRWVTYRDNGEEATLRFIVGNRRVAQCNIANLIDYEAGRQLSLEGFQADVQRLNQKAGHDILETSERLTGTSHRMLRVTVGGTVEGVPIRWIYYHLSNDTGRRLTMTFTLDEESLDTFAEQDQQIASTMELMPWPSKLDPSKLEPTNETEKSSEGAAAAAETASGSPQATSKKR